MAPGSNGPDETNTTSHDDKNKTPRHPRWTRQETIVLIQGKNTAEERGRRGRRSSSVFGSEQTEPKWDFVSSYCRQHGTNRGPVQCRKRWSNMVSDFKKIKTWEGDVRREGESYWTMRSDLRREKRLPGFFDRQVYDVLCGKGFTGHELALVTVSGDEEDDDVATDEDFVSEENGSSVDKGKAPLDGKNKSIPSPVPISEMRYQPFHQGNSNHQGTGSKRPASPHFCCRGFEFDDEVKKQRQSSQNINANEQLIKALERNTNLLNEHLIKINNTLENIANKL